MTGMLKDMVVIADNWAFKPEVPNLGKMIIFISKGKGGSQVLYHRSLCPHHSSEGISKMIQP